MELIVIEKHLEKPIGYYLSHSEYRCRCDHKDCTFTLLNPRLSEKYSELRILWDSAIGVTSGFRCQRHNKISGGARDSWHKKGSAIDIFPHNGDIEGLYRVAVELFDLVIFYREDGFLHCQMEN